MRALLATLGRGAWAVRRNAGEAALALAFFGGLGCIAGSAFWVYPPAGLAALGVELAALAALVVAGELRKPEGR